MDKRKKKAISATLAGIMSVGITGSVMTTANAAIVQTETAQQNASPQEVKPDNAVKPADMTAEEAPETVYKVLIDGTKDEALAKDVLSHVTKTKDGQSFKAEDVQADLDAIEASHCVQKVVGRTIQSNGRLYVVFSVTPFEKETDESAAPAKDEAKKPAAGQKFEATPQAPEAVTAEQDKKDKKHQKSDKAVKADQKALDAAKKDSAKKADEKSAKEAPAKTEAAKQQSARPDGKENIVDRVHKILDEYHPQAGKAASTEQATETKAASASSSSAKTEDVASTSKQDVPVIEDIEYVGNEKMKSWVLDKIVSKYVKKGDKIDTDRLQALYNELYATRYFKDLDVKLTQGSAPNAGIVQIVMKEDKTGEWTFGLGASSQNKVQAIGSVKDYNIGGNAQTAGIDFGIGTKRSNGEIYYTNPYVGGSDTSLNITGFMNQKDDEWRGYDYTEKRAGATMTIAKPISSDKSTKLYGGMSFSHITTDEKWIEDLNTTTAFLGVSQVRVDDAINTHKGFGWDVGAETSIKQLGSDYDFTKFHASVKGYAPLSSKGVLAGRLRYDYSNKTLPFLEQYTLGGTDSIRGLDDDELRGDKSLLGTVEYRQTLNDWLQAVAFVDFGRTWVKNGTGDETDFKVSPGVGLRAVTKMGILRFDAAKTSGHNMKFVFGIGQMF